ncbi:MAG: hypothetical protein FJZ80_05945 [Bacteroidetes bacterium]|nr:hypothetical protein [Bacteroidota bacterium]MBM3424707.1 hypothetical protein [Bacteroidota bacterium]
MKYSTFYLQFSWSLLLPGLLFAQVPQSNNSNGNLPPQEESIIPAFETDSVFTYGGAEDMNVRGARQEFNAYDAEVHKFKAAKSAVRMNTRSRSADPTQEQELDRLYMNANSINPSEPTNGALFYELGNYDASRAYWLERAVKAKPNDASILELWCADAVVTGDSVSLSTRLNRLDSLGSFPQNLRCYGQDLFASTPLDAVLVSHGRWDTFGFLFEQLQHKNSKIINASLEFLQSPQYRMLLQNKGLKIPSQKSVDVAFFKDLVLLNPEKTFAFSMTIPSAYLESFQNDMVPVGLVFVYPNESSDATILQQNRKLMKSLSYLDCGKAASVEYETLKDNYLPMVETVEQLTDHATKEQVKEIQDKKSVIKKRKAPKK